MSKSDRTEDRTERLKYLRTQYAFASMLAKAGDDTAATLKREINEEAEYLADADWDHASERVKQIEAKLEALGDRLPEERVDTLKQEACDLADVDTYEAALAAYESSEGEEDRDGTTERVEQIDAKLSAMQSTLPADRVATLREEACELTGTGTYEAALEASGLADAK